MYEFNVVTTFAARHTWGHDAVKAMDECLPSNCRISVYLEEMRSDTERVRYLPFDQSRAEDFARRYQPIKDKKIPRGIPIFSGQYDQKLYYMWDAARFCHKVFAMEHAARNQEERYLIWLDADTLFHSKCPDDWFNTMVEEGCYSSYLPRKTRHSETGFLIFDTHHEYHKTWWDTVIGIYDDCSFESCYMPDGYTDSHVHDYMIWKSGKEGIRHKNLCPKNANHAWKESRLHEHSSHYKGFRPQGHGSKKY